MASLAPRPRIRRYPPAPAPEPPPPPPLEPPPPQAQPAILTLDDSTLVLAIRVSGEPRAEIAELASLPALPAPPQPPPPQQPPVQQQSAASALAPTQANLVRVQAALAVAEQSVQRGMLRAKVVVIADALYFIVIFALAAAAPSTLGLDAGESAATTSNGLVIGVLAAEILAGAAGLAALHFRVPDGLGAYTMAQLCLTMACLRSVFFGWALVMLRSLALVSSLHMRLLLTARLLLETEGSRSLSAEAAARSMLTSGTRFHSHEVQRELNSRVAEIMANSNDAAERGRARVGPADGLVAAAAGAADAAARPARGAAPVPAPAPAPAGSAAAAAAAEEDAAFDAVLKWQTSWAEVASRKEQVRVVDASCDGAHG